ncbi:hypothetical protein WR25_22967 [Diploscapter pachys]|uniref:Pyroglutamyl-peptidase I n=1 Tax=Diploscapter pachys TaxID=2018661 RepID=A0A2A2JD48_9BILA|nr:hypothetical protein WR25_22967 [Diploscapter pachys]
MKTVVVTGFGPFGIFNDNPSTDVANRMKEVGIDENVSLIVEIMTVAYDEVEQKVEKLWKEHNPDLIIHIGAHNEPGCIKLEQQAFLDGYCRYDVKSCVPAMNVCPAMKDPILISEIDCARIVEQVSKKVHIDGIASLEKSEDPGRYLCGYSFYLSLSRDKSKSLFIHVPPFDEKCTLEVVAQVVKETIRCILGLND